MKIVIAGSGEVGTHLAKLLSNEEQDITVVDSDGEKLAMLDSNYNLLTFRGSPTSFSSLRQAGVEGCDPFRDTQYCRLRHCQEPWCGKDGGPYR